MKGELHVQYRLSAVHAKKLRAVAELQALTTNAAARNILIESLENANHQELLDQIAALQQELAELRAVMREQADDIKAFRTDFNAALKKAQGR